MGNEKLIIGSAVVGLILLANRDTEIIRKIPTDVVQNPNTRVLTIGINDHDFIGVRLAPIFNSRSGLTMGADTELNLGENSGVVNRAHTSREIGVGFDGVNLASLGGNLKIDPIDGSLNTGIYIRLGGRFRP